MNEKEYRESFGAAEETRAENISASDGRSGNSYSIDYNYTNCRTARGRTGGVHSFTDSSSNGDRNDGSRNIAGTGGGTSSGGAGG